MGSRDVLVGARAEHNHGFVGGFGFGVQEHSQKGVMVLPHHNPSSLSSSSSSPSFSSSPFSCCFGGGISNGSIDDTVFCASNNQTLTPCFNNMFYQFGSCGAASSTYPFSTLSSSGETGTTSMGEKASAFSEVQLQEFARQRNIYRYMMASAPVPAGLFVTNSKNPSNANSNAEKARSLKLGIASSASNNMDLEPWRCRRTDGKKWRCSRNVIPDNKYCERHSHKNRPRSRKPVELPPHTFNRSISTIATATKNNTDQYSRSYLQNPTFCEQSETQLAMDPILAAAPSSYDQHSGLRWFMKDDDTSAINPSNHDLRDMIQLKVGSPQEPRDYSGNSLGFDYDLNFGQNEQLVSQSFGSLEGLVSLNQTQALEARHFIDAFADEAVGSSLTLSMAGEVERSRNEAMDRVMGTNNQWTCHEGLSWLGSPPGGPLAEALCLTVSSNASSCSISGTTTSSCSRSSS